MVIMQDFQARDFRFARAAMTGRTGLSAPELFGMLHYAEQ
jgi:hypothetical protein